MCGIAGAVIPGRSTAEAVVTAMLPTLARRGPDGEGLAEWPGVALGHRRLAIIDLSPGGAQPMVSEDGNIGLVFNGCIYNFVELRKELEQRGRRFRSQCDTEVLLEGYREWGIHELLPRLHGMFAFAIWDEPRRKLFLARDRLGVKPLVYRAWGESIAFASTLGALQAAGLTGDIDPQSVLEFLDLGFVTDERSIYAGTRKLPPAAILEWSAGKFTERTYWTLPEFGQATGIRFEDAVDETERLIIEAVRLRLVSDVPVGALLSGGIDSTLVCWALSKLGADVRSFTVGTSGDADDESDQASEIARRLGIHHETVHLDSREPPPFDELVGAYSEPFASPSALGMLRVSRTVKPKATVLLTGDGGDDVFLGYSFFYNAWKAQKLACAMPAGSASVWAAVRPLVRRIPVLGRAQSFLDYATGGIGAYGRVRWGIPYLEQRGMMGDLLLDRKIAYREVTSSFASARRLLTDVFQFHRRLHFTSEFLTKVDGGTMHHSLEARAPFLDQSIWEYAARLPPEIHFRGGKLKSVLREIVRRRVGPDVAFRQKRGFTIPVERWLAAHWSHRLRELKNESLLASEGWMRPEAMGRAVDEALSRGFVPQQLWFVLTLEHWLRRHKAMALPAFSGQSPILP